MNWEKAAKFCEETFGSYVDWEERFFHCPECDEPLYECDWEDHDDWTVCPVCKFDFVTGEMVHEEEDDE